MRIGVNPRTSSSHAHAIKTLYRHLLRTTNSFDNTTLSQPIIHLIRHRFRKDKHIHSPRIIHDAIQTGRQAYSLLRSASSGNETAKTQLFERLVQIKARLSARRDEELNLEKSAKPPRPTKLAKMKHMALRADGAAHRAKPGVKKVLQRPLPREELPESCRGKPRRVPQYVVTGGVPFLRYSGRKTIQSPYLSRMIRQLTNRDQEKWRKIQVLEEEVEHAVLEDEWDEMLARCTGLDDREVKRWSEDVAQVCFEMRRVEKGVARKRYQMGEKLYAVMLKEKALAEEEKAAKRAKRIAEKYSGIGAEELARVAGMTI